MFAFLFGLVWVLVLSPKVIDGPERSNTQKQKEAQPGSKHPKRNKTDKPRLSLSGSMNPFSQYLLAA